MKANDVVNMLLGETGHTQRWASNVLDLKEPAMSRRLKNNAFYAQELLDLADGLQRHIRAQGPAQDASLGARIKNAP